MKSWGNVALTAALLSAFPAGGSPAAPEQGLSGRGVVVDEVGQGSALEKAGVKAGDVLLSWERPAHPPADPEGARGEIESVFDWMWLQVEQAPRGTVVLLGEREGKEECFTVPMGLWDAQVRAGMPPALAADYLRGKELVAAEDFTQGIILWEKVAETAQGGNDGHLRCWLHLRTGRAWAKAREWEKAHAAYRSALAEAGTPEARVAVWGAIAVGYKRQSDFVQAEASYREALRIQEAAWGESLSLATSQNDLGVLALIQGRLNRAEEALQSALDIRRRLASKSLAVAGNLNNLAVVAGKRSELELAEGYYQQALEIQESLAPKSVPTAKILNNLGLVAQDRGRFELAEEYYRRALEIEEELVPESLIVANPLNNLGLVALYRGDPDRAEDYIRQALEIRERLIPEGLAVATSLHNLGVVAHTRGELHLAQEYYQRGLAIREKLAPGSLPMSSSLLHLGGVGMLRGELELAESYFQRGLQIVEALAPESFEAAGAFTNLGLLAEKRDELELAWEYHQRARQIYVKLAPGSLDVAGAVSNLGGVAMLRGELELAREYLQRALEIQEERAPASRSVSITVHSLGVLAVTSGKPELAEEYYQQALEITASCCPGSIEMAHTLSDLGQMALERGEPELAEPYLERALEIRERLAPGSFDLATTLNLLGTLSRGRGELHLAAQYLERSFESLETQVEKLGGSHDVKAGFRARAEDYYRDPIELFLEMNRPERAFAVLERSRARSFLAMLAERDLLFTADVPQEVEHARRRLTVQHDRIQNQMAGLSPEQDGEKIEQLLSELRRLRREREEIVAKIRQASPQLAALHYPQPLELREVRENLDPGTLMLSYSVGETRSDLFAVTREDKLEVHTLPVGEDALRREVDALRQLIAQARPDSRTGSGFLAAFEGVSKRLGRVLIEPVAERVAQSQRVLIIPDGPLHLLPFGALTCETAAVQAPAAREGQYLVEWKPLHSVLSATVYAQLRDSRPQPGHDRGGNAAVQLTAFGDPYYPQALRDHPNQIADVRLRSAVDRGLVLEPLPSTRQEVEGIAAYYPSDATRIYLGTKATEERAKTLGRGIRYLHFATHGVLDPRFPLNSGLALSIPEEFDEERDNGLLQAWEILESVRLDADLVVLSACRSGLGREQGGEGLIGLTRAFQYAGARSVAATLWQVDDQVTAELMVRFHRHLKAGRSQDEALRAAQIELIRKPIRIRDETGQVREIDASAPHYWAAFQIFGDWR
ncbi:MAG: CHAT domain-containing protein [bacterium]|nr:CHAT domain-containing protein [bacterium]